MSKLIDWSHEQRDGLPGFLHFLSHVKRGDTFPSWFTDDFKCHTDYKGWLTVGARVLLCLVTLGFSMVGFGIYMLISLIWGWLFVIIASSLIGFIVLVPLFWRWAFRMADKLIEAKKTVERVKAVAEAAASGGDQG